MAGAKRSQFEQFTQRFPSNSPQTDFLPSFSLIFRLLARFLSNFECKSQKVVKLLKFDFPHKFCWKWRTCWFNFHFARQVLNMRLVLTFGFSFFNMYMNTKILWELVFIMRKNYIISILVGGSWKRQTKKSQGRRYSISLSICQKVHLMG